MRAMCPYRGGVNLAKKSKKMNKIEITIEKIKKAENLALSLNQNGFWVAFSGGKDSQVLLDLVRRAGVKYRAVYSVTGNDSPENVYFIRKYYPDVEFYHPKEKYIQLVRKHGLPTMVSRYCCEKLKEHSGEGYMVLTGVRADESRKRAKYMEVTVQSRRKEHEGRENYSIEEIEENEHRCIKGKDVLMFRPILSWKEDEVWEYIKSERLPVNPCYETVHRVGCMFCPFSSKGSLDYYEQKYAGYKRAVLKALKEYMGRNGNKGEFESEEECYEWWKTKMSVEKWKEKKRQLEMGF